jgi:hypothetical protein
MKNNKQKKQSNKRLRKFLTPAFVAFTLLSITLLFTIILAIYRDYLREMDAQGKRDFTLLISKSVEGLTQDAPIASYSNQQFIDSAKVKFTKTEATSLVYSYRPPDPENEQSESIQLSSRILVDYSLNTLSNSPDFTEMINKVPGVQSCSRLFIISFEDMVPDFYSSYSKVSSKLLADGRTAYIWKATGDLCLEAEDSFGEELLSVINTIQSY